MKSATKLAIQGELGSFSHEAAERMLPGCAVVPCARSAEVFDRLEREVNLEIQAQGNETMDPAYAVRFAFALVYGVAVLDEALFPPGQPRPDHASIADQMSGFVLRGSIMPGADRRPRPDDQSR